MKKKLISLLCAGSIAAFAATAFAADTPSTQAANFGLVTVTVAGVPSTTTAFTFSPSPSVGISIIASDTAYSIMSANSLTDTTNGLEYGTLSSATGYAQGTKTTAAGTGPSTTGQTSTALSTAVTWGWMGGS